MSGQFVHAARVALVIALLLLIPSPAPRSMNDGSVAPTIEQLSNQLRQINGVIDSLKIDSDPNADGMWRLTNGAGDLVGLVARTLPSAEDVVGYRGPTEAAIIFDDQLRIVSVGLLNSADTEEHVQAVKDEQSFFEQFHSWSWGGPTEDVSVDSVSGATLTSLAMAEGILKRIGGARPSLIFGSALQSSDLEDLLPPEWSVDEEGWLYSDAGLEGRILRTGPHSDDGIGYQGPTEMLLRVNNDNQIVDIRIAKSFDNEPYVTYVRDEKYFWNLFRGMTIQELADFDPVESRVEGVSGATMTSLTVADTLVAAAKSIQANANEVTKASKPAWHETVRWSVADIATILVLALLGFISQSSLFRKRNFRRLWLVMMVIVIGIWAGNLVSMALVAGWSAEGVAWRLAPGLSAIVAVTFLLPPITKSNPYCNHLCPHGAIQQLIKPGSRSRRRWKIKPKMLKWFSQFPGVMLVVAYVTLLLHPSIDLSSWEPFHAYLFRIAGWGAFALALLSLALAAVIPMGYCRLGCPTGRLIDYLRRSAASNRIGKPDIVALSLLALALLVNQAGLTN